jgi:O-methyltransferase
MQDSWILRLVQDASAPLVTRMPVEGWPSWLGHLQEMRVPSTQARHPKPSPTGAANIKIVLALLKECLALKGDVAECGVYRGSSLLTMGLYLKQRRIPKMLLGFDSFEGFPGTVAVDLRLGGAPDEQKRHGGFSDANYTRLSRRIALFGLTDRVRLVKGLFDHTLPQVQQRTFCFVHLDVDIYDSYRTCLDFFYPRLVKSGVILLDEYDDPPWPGCNKAVDEFLADKPEKPVAIESDNFVKYFIRKT